MWKFLEKRPFFQADMAGLGKCCTDGYSRIGVYRDKMSENNMSALNLEHSVPDTHNYNAQ